MADGRGLVVRVELAEIYADMGLGGKGAETRLEGLAHLSICWAFCLRGQYNMQIPRKGKEKGKGQNSGLTEFKSVNCSLYRWSSVRLLNGKRA